ncbi:DUF1173 family protein [Duganella vulcania]|uniref:DUF1173 family protein n=1 Tax=Duganella vulcania TaxID=2692166 RepID=A0A845GDQ5_9BURK|nr:DUF1173 family protein [Duganella vulcania]MYM92753.1 DUF1173 family protein [Duganella vulcania]
MQQISIFGQRYELEWLVDRSTGGQEVLRAAYDAGHTPLCMCRDDGVGISMYISRHTRYFVARLPESGNLHSPSCPSYQEPVELSGRRNYTDTAMAERDDQYFVSPGFALHGWWSAAVQTTPPASDREAKKHHVVGLTGLLNLLLDTSRFTTWHPKMGGKRNWPVFRHHVLSAAKRIHVAEDTLSECLFMPEGFDRSRREAQIDNLRNAIDCITGRVDGTARHLLLLGQVKAHTKTSRDDRIMVSHLPETPIWMPTAFRPLITRAVAEFEPFGEAADCRLLILAHLRVDSRGGFQMQDCAFQCVDREWIPVFSRLDQKMGTELRGQGRSYSKLLRYETTSDPSFPDYLLLDVGDRPACLEILSGFSSRRSQKARLDAIAARKAAGSPTWVWDVLATGTGNMPALPSALRY